MTTNMIMSILQQLNVKNLSVHVCAPNALNVQGVARCVYVWCGSGRCVFMMAYWLCCEQYRRQ